MPENHGYRNYDGIEGVFFNWEKAATVGQRISEYQRTVFT
jgi:hypothetical protein